MAGARMRRCRQSTPAAILVSATSRPFGLARRRSSAWSEPRAGPPIESVGDAGKGLGQGGQVPVAHPPSVERGGEPGKRRAPHRALGDDDHGHFLHNGDEPVDFDDSVDALNRGALGRSRTGELPGPVPARGRAPFRDPTLSHVRRAGFLASAASSGRKSCHCRTLDAVLCWSKGMREALPVIRKGPLTWVETRGIEPRTSCLQSRRSTN